MNSSSQRRSESAIRNALTRGLDWVRRTAQAAVDALAESTEDGPQLKPLTPKYDPTEHKVYADAIEVALSGPDAAVIHNIALTGAYGAGKSSVLSEVVRAHPKAVSISLSTLGGDVAVAPNGDDKKDVKAETPTNRIQKEIVKQLLYQAGPAQLPGSRYRQLGRLRKWRTLAIALAVGLGLAMVAYVTSLTGKVTPLFATHVPSPLIPVAVSWLVATAAVFAVIALLHNRVSIDKLGAASATISLSRKSETFFDEYLDEIVYFFDVSRRDIVVFEDIDRFDEPNIFKTLRALNTLLNSAKQLRGRNIRFIYAIKDSIFDALSKREAAEQVAGDETADFDTVAAEVARANRTKFFDLVVPIVPFVTHLSARDLMHGVMRGIEPTVDPLVMDLVAGQLPDMRLIIEARNEYLVFSRVVLSSGSDAEGLKLDPTSLFAMMLYKSTHLSDFEAIRKGESHLDRLFDLRGELISSNLASLNERALLLRRQTTAQRRLHTRTAALGDNLVEFVVRLGRWSNQPSSGRRNIAPTFIFDGVAYTADDVKAPAFWQAFAANPGTVSATMPNPPYSQYSTNITADDMKTFIATPFPDASWFRRTTAQIDSELEQISTDRTFLAHATMQDLYAQARFKVNFDGNQMTFAEVAGKLIPSALARRLIEKGYIDADFTLYTSKYYGDRVTARASNFILHNVDRGQIDFHAPLDSSEVESILRERTNDVLTERAILNISIFDHLLQLDGAAAQVLLERFTVPDEDELRFLEAYLVEGEQRLTFTRRLASVWSGILPFVVERVDVVEGAALKLLDAVLRGLSDDDEPDVDDGVKVAIDAHYIDLPSFTMDEDVPTEAIAGVLDRANVSIADLTALTPSMRDAVVARSLYPITRGNLIAAVESEDLALDNVRRKDSFVYSHVLDNMGDYLEALKSTELAVANAQDFVQVLDDVATRAPDAIDQVVARAAHECRVENLTSVPQATWSALASTDRFPASMSNAALYIGAKSEIDAPLGGLLQRAGSISVTSDDDQDARQDLAVTILDARTAIPSQSDRVNIVGTLALADYIPAERITPEKGELVSLLISAHVIEDDADSFALTNGLDWASREKAIAASAAFSSFLLASGIRANEVPPLLASTLISKPVRDDVARSAEQFVPANDRVGWNSVAQYATANGLAVSIANLVRMASVRVSPQLVLDLLQPHLFSATAEELTPLMEALGSDYERMLSPTRKQSKIINTSASALLADRLRTVGAVSKVVPSGSYLIVYMRH